MPRAKSEYQLYPRTHPSGKKIWYVYTYDKQGKRVGRSTGHTTKTAAERWVKLKMQRGEIAPGSADRFGVWAADWWIWGKCKYIQSRRGQVGHSHADTQRAYLVTHITPYFKNMRIDAIGPQDVETWVSDMLANGKSASMVNHCLRTLNVMFNEAERLELITRNPARTVRRLPEPKKRRVLLTVAEVADLFDDKNYRAYWHENNLHYTINLVAASTGLRLGEIQAGFQLEHFEDVAKV